MKKKIVLPIFMLACLVSLAGCTKVSLTGTSGPGNASGTPEMMDGGTPPEDGGTPPEGMTPPTDGGSAPSGAPSGTGGGQ